MASSANAKAAAAVRRSQAALDSTAQDLPKHAQTKKDIDELFDTWDSDGGGSLDFKELRRILSAPAKGAK